MQAFEPPAWLRNPHVQTILGSTGRRLIPSTASADVRASETQEDVTLPCGVTLRAKLNAPAATDAPLVAIIHGWLGCDYSSYVLSAAARLLEAGYGVARINLRDHGGSESLNVDLYNSARTLEVVELVQHLAARSPAQTTAVIGFSLGGNFALRVARATGYPTLAVCPALDPATTLERIDGGSPVYRGYFLRKWHNNLRAKEAAFPKVYNFRRAYSLRSVSAMTDHFVRDHSDYDSTPDYFADYDLTGDALEGVRATIVYAADDPVIPIRQFQGLPPSIELVPTRYGGHVSYLENARLNSWVDRYALHWLAELDRR